MNRQIRLVGLVALAMLVALVVATTYWQTWAVAGLEDRQDNAIQRVAQFSIERGRIFASDGRTVLASNVKRRVKGQTLYFRRYPRRGLTAHAVGYSTQVRYRTGLERALNDYLTASNSNLSTVLDKTLDKLAGTTVKGNDVVITINPRVQRLALSLLAGSCGAAVALDPRTGKVLVLTSSPTYNPNAAERNFRLIRRVRGACNPASPLLNRAAAGLYVPGSTFKVVTAAAALDSGAYTPDSRFVDPGYCVEYGKRVRNAGNPEAPETFGSVNLVQGLEHSINSVFCNIGKRLGAGKILDYAQRFGFYSLPPLETPAGERAASGLYQRGRLYRPKHDFQVDPGRLAFGQERLLVTPLQMAMVAAAVANNGVLMRPTLLDRVLKPNGKTLTRNRPDALDRAIKPQTAAQLRMMMEASVRSGTGTHAQISGVRVGGKTGTAETGVNGRNTTWFIAFAPVEAPRVAVAVVLENQSGFGGTTAAPIVKRIMEALLGVRSN